MAENAKDPEQGGGKAAGVQIFLQIRRPIGVALRCRDVGGYPMHGTGPGEFPRSSGAETDGAASMAEVRQKVGVYLGGGGERGDSVLADVNLHSAKAEYGRAVYYNAINYGPM